MNIKLISLFATLTISLSFVGCSVIDTVSGDKKDEFASKAEQALNQAHQYIPQERKYSNIIFENEFFVPKAISTKQYNDWYYEIVDYRFDETSLRQIMTTFGDNQSGVIARSVEEGGDNSINMDKTFPLYFSGRRGEALQSISLATGYGYQIEGNLITWSQFTTETFLLSVPPSIQSFRIGDKDKEQNTNDQSSSGSMTIETLGASDAYSNIEVKNLDTWAELIKTIEMLKSDAGEISFDKSSSLLLVKDFPRNVRAISQYVNKLRNVSMTQVVFDFHFLEYKNTEGGSASLNLDLINSFLGLNPKNISGTFASEFTQSLLTDTVASSLSLGKSSGKWAGSQVIIEALRKQGVVSVLSKPTVLASHNKNAFIDLGESIAFASASSTNQNQTSTASGLTTTFLDLGTRINVVPTILDDSDELFVQLGIDMSSLEQIREFESNGSKVQQPNTKKQKMVLNFSAHSGETILITGNESNRNQYQSADSGWLSMLLGGARSSSEEYTEMLILITPRIVRPTRS